MLIKWVRCRVVDREAFSRGQEGWGELAAVPGFLGQCGGWSRGHPGIAHVFAWWRSAEDHEAFLAGPHDRLAAAQAGSYRDIQVHLVERFAGVPAWSRVEDDLASISGDRVALERAWTVLP